MARGEGRRRGGERRRGRRSAAGDATPAGGAPAAADGRADGADGAVETDDAAEVDAVVGAVAADPGVGEAGVEISPFQALLDLNPLGALVVDADRRVVLHNAPAAALFGAHHDDLVNERFPYPITEAPAEISRRDASGAAQTYEVAWRSFGGLDRTAWLVSVRHLVEHPTPRATDDDARFGASTHDALTGLPGRELLLNHVFDAARLSGELDVDRFALVVIDLERFGRINDEHGHAAGDRVLETIAARLTSAVRANDYVSRIGGDEFAIVLPAQPVAAHRGITDRIEEVLARPIVVDGTEIVCTPVIGMAEHVDDDDEDSLLERATAAMVASEPGTTNLAPRPALRPEVAAAPASAIHTSGRVSEGEVLLHFQPVFDLPGGSVSSIEVLARWEHPDDGLVVPDESTRVELDGGAVLGLGEWVIREACEQVAAWTRDLPDYLVPPISVNLSARELSSTGIHAHALAELARHGLPPAALRFEITEAVLLDRDPRVEVLLRAIAADGIGLVLDAFGTGLASLTHLQVFPLAGLKVDRSFVTRMMDDEPSGQIVLAAIDAGRTFEVPVTAVGVETSDQRSALERLGCDHAQGFLLARPGTAVEATRFFDRDPASLRARPGGPLLRSSGAYTSPTVSRATRGDADRTVQPPIG
jgi:diguanylate cyclase (GGDEF)-like protein